MSEDGDLNTARNMQHTCKGTTAIKINLCCVRLNKLLSFINKYITATLIKMWNSRNLQLNSEHTSGYNSAFPQQVMKN